MSPIERAANRYLPAGRFAHGFAKGKMNGDPAYARVLELLTPEGTLVDVGCGEAVLRGAHVYARGVRAASFGVAAGDEVGQCIACRVQGARWDPATV